MTGYELGKLVKKAGVFNWIKGKFGYGRYKPSSAPRKTVAPNRLFKSPVGGVMGNIATRRIMRFNSRK